MNEERTALVASYSGISIIGSLIVLALVAGPWVGAAGRAEQETSSVQSRKVGSDTAAQFKILTQEWAQHCRSVAYSSNMKDYLNHPAYHGLIALGAAAVPLIMERYRSDDLPWGFVLEAITGVVMMQDPDRFSPSGVRQRWLAWWQKNETNWTVPPAPTPTGPPPIDGEAVNRLQVLASPDKKTLAYRLELNATNSDQRAVDGELGQPILTTQIYAVSPDNN